MANIKDLKKKIKSTKSTLKITTAMKLVSAAKLAKAQGAIVGARPYADELEQTIKTVSALAKITLIPFSRKTERTSRPMSSLFRLAKGLCGGYNAQLTRSVREFLKNTELNLKVHYLGKKGREILSSEVREGERSSEGTFYAFEKQEPTYQELKDLAFGLARDIEQQEVGQIFVAYNVFHSAMHFSPTVRRLLPMTVESGEKAALQEKWPFDFKYEPAPEEILETLIPEAYFSALHTCFFRRYRSRTWFPDVFYE